MRVIFFCPLLHLPQLARDANRGRKVMGWILQRHCGRGPKKPDVVQNQDNLQYSSASTCERAVRFPLLHLPRLAKDANQGRKVMGWILQRRTG
jgi:hypothetical protein